MTKTIISVRIENEYIKILKEKNINISGLINDLIADYLKSDQRKNQNENMNENENIMEIPKFIYKVIEKIDMSKAWAIDDIILSPDGIYIYHDEMVDRNTIRMPWACIITGSDEKYVFARQFLNTRRINDKVYHLIKYNQMPAIVQFHGGSRKYEYKPLYLIFRDTDGKIKAKSVSEKTVLEALNETKE